MKLALTILTLALAAFVAGCSPAVSLRPLYTDTDLQKPIVEPRIEGEWITPDTDKAGTDEELWLRWKITPPPKESDGSYSVEFRPVKPDAGKGDEISSYDVRLVSIGNELFFDAEFRKHTQGQFEVGRQDVLGLVPAHLVGRIWVQQDFLRITLLDGKWVEENSPAGFREIVNTDKYGHDVAITGSTQELRDFLVHNADDQKALAYVAYLCRPGTDCSSIVAEDALARTPDDQEVLDEAASFFLKRGNYARAIALERHEVALDPKNGPRHSGLAEALLFSRDFQGARNEYAAAQELLLRAFPTAQGPQEKDSVASAYAYAGEGMVWSNFLEGKYDEAVAAAAKYKPPSKNPSINPILLSYFSQLRLGRRAKAEAMLKQETAKFTGPKEDHILFLLAQGRVTDNGIPSQPPENDEARLPWLVSGLEANASGNIKWARSCLQQAVSKAPNDSLIALAARIELERLDSKSKE